MKRKIVTSRDSFALDDGGLPEQETIPALLDEMDYQGAVQAYLWAMPQMVVAGQNKMDKFYGAEGNLDFLAVYKDPGVYGMLTPSTIVKYIVNYYNLGKMGPMVLEISGGQLVGLMMDYQMHWVTDLGLVSKAGISPEKIVFIGQNQNPPDEALASGWHIERVQTTVSLAVRVLNPEKDAALAKGIRVYPWSQRDNPPANPVFQARGPETGRVTAYAPRVLEAKAQSGSRG